jgi:hypothetical protein
MTDRIVAREFVGQMLSQALKAIIKKKGSIRMLPLMR